jgi:hypothetical protein
LREGEESAILVEGMHMQLEYYLDPSNADDAADFNRG